MSRSSPNAPPMSERFLFGFGHPGKARVAVGQSCGPPRLPCSYGGDRGEARSRSRVARPDDRGCNGACCSRCPFVLRLPQLPPWAGAGMDVPPASRQSVRIGAIAQPWLVRRPRITRCERSPPQREASSAAPLREPGSTRSARRNRCCLCRCPRSRPPTVRGRVTARGPDKSGRRITHAGSPASRLLLRGFKRTRINPQVLGASYTDRLLAAARHQGDETPGHIAGREFRASSLVSVIAQATYA